MSTWILIATGVLGTLAVRPAPAGAERLRSPAETRALLERLLLENIAPLEGLE